MRIAYITGRYPKVSHTFILREVQALRRLGVEVETVSIHRAKANDLLSAVDRAEDARTFAVLPPRWWELLRAHLFALLTRPRRYAAAFALTARLSRPGLRGRLWSLFYFAEAGLVWRHLHGLDIDHMHVHHLTQASDVAMLAIELEGERAGGRRWTWSFSMHGPDEFFELSDVRLLEKAGSASAVSCISDFARSQVMALLDEDEWSKLWVIHNGVDPNHFAPAPARDDGAGPLNVLYIGRMVPVKGQALLVDAIEELRRSGLNVEATLLGDGARRERLQRTVRERHLEDVVKLPGAVGQDEIRMYYAQADIFVLPSFAEGVPGVLMEAMAMGLPVVTTRIAGIPELVEDGYNGLVVAPGRVDVLVDAVQRLAADADLRRQMGDRGRAKVVAEYSIEPSAAHMREMFAWVVARNSRTGDNAA
jgi:glycosyltransferase involved in cell wall biosynthesis